MMSRLCALSIALIAILQLQNGNMWSLAANLNPVCNTTECQRLGKYYLQNIDPLGQPCSDFYDYVCSNWGIHNPRPKDLYIQFMWNVHHSLEMKMLQDMRNLLESKTPSTSSDFEQAKFLYKTCMYTPYMETTTASAVWNVMKKVPPFPFLLPKDAPIAQPPFFWETDHFYIETTGESALFDFYPMLDESTKTEIITNLQYLPSSYGALARPVGWPRPNELESYKAFLYKLIKSIVDPEIKVNKEVLENDINDVIQFREKLNTIINKYASHDGTEIVTIKKFQSWYTSYAKSKPTADINWLKVIRAMYKNVDDPRTFSIMESSKVRVHVAYFMKLAGLLADTNIRTLVNHIHLFFAERHVEWTSSMAADLSGSVAGTGIKGIIRSANVRWKKCIKTNNLKIAMAKAYVRAYFPAAEKAKVSELFETIKKTLGMGISQSTWLDANAKQAPLNKLAATKSTIGYPDWYDGTAPARLTLSEPDPLSIDVSYLPEQSRIIISAAVLQSPIYTSNAPEVVNYGSLGSQFGHELHHLFDFDGMKFVDRRLASLWSRDMRTYYQSRSICFLKHFKKYNHELQHLKLDDARTWREDMADAMGLKVAYAAFKDMLKKNNGVCQILPGFEKFGCEQLFFIAFASNFCSATLPGYNELMWFRNNYNLPQIRVNGAVANMKEFSKAFNCKSSDPLNVKETCDLW